MVEVFGSPSTRETRINYVSLVIISRRTEHQTTICSICPGYVTSTQTVQKTQYLHCSSVVYVATFLFAMPLHSNGCNIFVYLTSACYNMERIPSTNTKLESRIQTLPTLGGACSRVKREYRNKVISTLAPIYKCGLNLRLMSCLLILTLRESFLIFPHNF
jgi:hypothetical protein